MTKKSARSVPRFLAPDLDPDAREVRLPPDESRHLARVMRLGPGALVGVFDGRGQEFLARVISAGDALAVVALEERIEAAPESAVPFTLVQAVLKGAAMDDVVRDATMMGASAIQPVLTAHTAVKPAVATRPENVLRWRRIAAASAKQSRRARLPDVRDPIAFESAWSVPAALSLMFVEPSTSVRARSMRSLIEAPRPESVALVVGPEGGWSGEEIDLAAQRGAILVTLGRLTLRADAVPVAAIANVRLLWDEGVPGLPPEGGSRT